ncbi:MAG: hypothetical protein HYR67_04755 [Bacteroidetes bacterium]|nr:hypothetical protein [Bacteroidota bacterium]
MSILTQNKLLRITALFIITISGAKAQDNGQFQVNLKNLIPPSPTVAALGNYGNTPVSFYTGASNVSIPLYEVKTNDFSLPISLSYQSGGVRVEEQASWVGLSWSLNAGGIITRNVRGFVDESNGYINPVHKVSDLLAMSVMDREEILRQGRQDLDFEPDMFFFNFGSHSGKFYYDQEAGKFIVIPQKAISIDKDYFLSTGKWKIVTEDGAEFHFDNKEINTTFSDCDGNASTPQTVTTGWFLTKIITPVTKEEINFNYDPASYQTKTIHNVTKNVGTGGALASCVKPKTTCNSVNNYSGYRLKSITYPNGSVSFIANTDRKDLLGDKRLDNIKVYSFNNTNPFKQFKLDYEYFNGYQVSDPVTVDQSYLIRLKLKSVTEISAGGNSLPPYSFNYNESNNLPSRLSYDQDAWGFYNGPKNNQDLVPPYRQVSTMSGFIYWPGADRTVDDQYTGIATLTKIVYPTGGSTTFECENHTVSGYVPYSTNDFLTNKGQYLDVTNVCNQPLDYVYCKQVTFNDHLYDGVFITIEVDGILNCDHCPNASTCAIMSIEGQNYSLPITCNVTNFYIPNGTYTLKADFHNNPSLANFQDFAIHVSWSEYALNSVTNFKVGGLRVKKITDDDGKGNTKVRLFDYSSGINGASSGSLVTGSPVYEYSQPCKYGNGGIPTDFIEGVYTSRTSFSNFPLATTQGSHVGYANVTVTYDNQGVLGKSKYYYSTAEVFPDMDLRIPFDDNMYTHITVTQDNGYPFPPQASFDHRRGQLQKEEEYRWQNNIYQLVKSVENTYLPLDNLSEETLQTNSVDLTQITLGIKNSPWGIFGHGEITFSYWALYKIVSEWVRPSQTTTRMYNNGDPNSYSEVVGSNTYGSTQHLQVTKKQTVQSDGSTFTTYSKYPLDYGSVPSGTTDPSTLGIKKLQDSHILRPALETFITRKAASDNVEKLIGGNMTTYKSTSLVPDALHQLSLPASLAISSFTNSSINSQTGTLQKDPNYELRLLYDQYGNQANLLQQSKVNDVKHSYLWDYNNTFVVGEVTNATQGDIAYAGFESDGLGNWTISSSLREPGSVSTPSFTGAYHYNIANGALSKSGLTSTQTYRLSFWSRSGGISVAGVTLTSGPSRNGWSYYEAIFTGKTSISLNGTGYIDELRLCPSASQMTTYSYDPARGVTSATDNNNLTIYYSYDDFGRLSMVKDHNGKILKSYAYHYKGQN